MTIHLPEPRILPPGLTLDPPVDPRGLGGLIALAESAELPLPLERVVVRAAIAGDCCRTVIEQRFHNPHDRPLEALHIFPLPEDGAVVEMLLRAGEVEVRAECREREAALRTFEAAREAGHRAGLLTQERADVHSLRVTNLPPRTGITVRIVVVERLAAVDGRLQWRFPTVIAPRYLPGEPIGHAGAGVLPDTDLVPDASRLQPPLRLAGGTILDLEVEIQDRVSSIASTLHAVRMELGEGGAGGAFGVRIAPSGQATLDRDFGLSFSGAAADRAAARAFSDGAHTLLIVEPPRDLAAPPMPRDAVFVVDVSGSMSGAKLGAARRALSTALHGLMAGDRFRLIAFNQGTWSLAPDFEAYDQASLERAEAWIRRLEASGGTEMLPAIQAALEGETPEGRLRTVLFITDGQAWNEASLVAAVAHRRRGALFFTMGIDTAVNGALLKRLAALGGGTCELLTPADDIEAAVARFEGRFGSPLVQDIRVSGLRAARETPLTLFAGRPASLLLEGAPQRIAIEGRTAAGPWREEISPAALRFPLGALWARERVAALEDRMALYPSEAEGLRPEILRVALAHGILSSMTAFVAVDRSVSAEGERIEIVQPVELPQGWDPAFLDQAAFASYGALPQGRAKGSRLAARALGERMDFMLDATDLIRLDSHPAEPLGPGFDVSSAPPDLPGEADRVLAAFLAQAQGADGAYGGDVERTAAALLALVLLGHTRRRGLRQRVVAKAAAWLEAHREQPSAAAALARLAEAEAGATREALAAAIPEPLRAALGAAGEEGRALRLVLAG